MKRDDDEYIDPRHKLLEGIMYGLVIAVFLWGMIIASWLYFTA